MSLIFNCTVDSSPARIRFTWAGSFKLKDTSAFLVDQSEVTALGGAKDTLHDWSVSLDAATAPTGTTRAKHVYDVELTPGPGASFSPAPADLLEFVFAFTNAGKVVHGDAYAIVDYACDDVAEAINAARQDFTTELSASRAEFVKQVAAARLELAQQAGAIGKGLGDTGTTLVQELKLLTGYPFQVAEGTGTAPSPSGTGTSAAATVDAQLRAVLGRTPGRTGVTATLAALDRNFQQVIDDGVVNWVWRPRSYAVQSDIGAGVTGEQASLARLAASIGDEIVPLVSGLTPLVPENTVNPDEIEAARAIFTESWPALVAEVGSDGGPRIPRATQLLMDSATQLVTLGILIGVYQPGVSLANTDLKGTQFDPFTVSTWPVPDRRNGVVTGRDEENYTNFVIVAGRIRLFIAEFLGLFVPAQALGDRGFLVSLLQRALDATGEAADAVYAALDSVNLGEDERRLIYLVPGDLTSLTVEDVVSWAASFPEQEAAPLLQDAGNIGATSIAQRAQAIEQAFAKLVLNGNAPPSAWPLALSHPRVQAASAILLGALQDVINQAGNLPYAAPTTP